MDSSVDSAVAVAHGLGVIGRDRQSGGETQPPGIGIWLDARAELKSESEIDGPFVEVKIRRLSPLYKDWVSAFPPVAIVGYVGY
jgi:hypothetical protein